MKITIVTEAYNITEGQSAEALRRTINFIDEHLESHPDHEALLMDSADGVLAGRLLEGLSDRWRCISRQGANYEVLKDLGVQEARGEYVCYLDGDCIPHSKDWVHRILAPIREGITQAVGGLTIYEGDSALAHACSILDFGFLFQQPGTDLGCYASNNVAFTRAFRLESKPPQTEMRCTCYAHAQQLWRDGTPVLFEPKARAYHELPSVKKERFRRGYDHVASCWTDPMVLESGMLDGDEGQVVRRISERQLRLAKLRHQVYRDLVELDDRIHDEIDKLLPRLVALERFGIHCAYREGQMSGANARAMEAHRQMSPKASALKRFRHKVKGLLVGGR